MNDLLEITPRAIEALKRVAIEEDKDLRIRIALQGGGCSGYKVDMHFTKFPPDEEFDLTFTKGGIEFAIDEKSASFLQGAILDYGGELLDRGFKWTFPKATGGCGCGVSFSF